MAHNLQLAEGPALDPSLLDNIKSITDAAERAKLLAEVARDYCKCQPAPQCPAPSLQDIISIVNWPDLIKNFIAIVLILAIAWSVISLYRCITRR